MPPSPPAKPWKVYIAYCLIVALLNIGLALGGLWLAAESIQDDRSAEQGAIMLATGMALVMVGIPFAVLNAILPWLRRSKSMYWTHIINLVLGTALLPPLTIWLLIQFSKPPMKQAFGVGATVDADPASV